MMGFVTDSGHEWRRWALSGVIVIMAHGGLAASVVHWLDASDPDDPSSAMVIDLAPMPVAPAARDSELPPGPEQVQAEAVPDRPVEKVEDKPDEKVETTEQNEPQIEVAPIVESEVVLVALPPKPQTEAPTPAVQQTPAPATTAPQLASVAPAPVAAAPTQGQRNLTNSNAIPNWKRQILTLLERNKRYPEGARGAEGIAQVAFILNRQGQASENRIVKSSGNAVLDQEALEWIKRAEPFPPPPADMPGEKIPMAVPYRFNVR